MKGRLLAWWLSPMPALRLALLRILLGAFALGYLALRVPNVLGLAEFPAERFAPVGLCSALSAPVPSWALAASLAFAVASGLAFVLGLAYQLSGPSFALSFLAVATYRSSWGMIFHTENLLALHLLLLAASRAADTLSLDARRRPSAHPGPHAEYGWVVRAMCLVTVLTYVLAGVAKLKLAGGPWLAGDLLRRQIAYDNLRKLELGTSVSPLGPWLVRQRAAFPPLAIATMLVELGAPLSLLHPRVTRLWVAAAWCFHLGVLLTMSIAFFYQLAGFAYLPFFALERPWQALLRRRQG